MHFERKLVLGDVDRGDRRFAIESHRPNDDLSASVRRVGILQPVWLQRRETGGFRIVDGFQRIDALVETGPPDAELPALVFDAEADETRLALHRIEAKLCGAPLNVAERAQIVQWLVTLLPADDVVGTWLPLLGVPRKPGSLDGWLRLAEAGEELLRAAASEAICERAALELAGWGDPARDVVLSFLERLRCSASIQVEILDRLLDLARGETGDVPEILERADVRRVLDHPDWNRRRQTQALREFLRRRLLPRLSAREDRFRRDLERAALPCGLRLTPPRDFEGERWRVELDFGSSSELQRLLDAAGERNRSGAIESLMHPGDPESEREREDRKRP